MAYLIIPNSGDKLKISQGQIQTNFSDLKNTFDINHVALTGLGGDEGKHKFLQMPEQTSSPGTIANEGSLFTGQGDISGIMELFFQRENQGSGASPNWNAKAITESRNAVTNMDDGFLYLAGGTYLLRWNRYTNATVQSSYTVSFTGNPGPAFSGLPIVWTIPIKASGIFTIVGNTVSNVTVNDFILYVRETSLGVTRVDPNGADSYWFALGLAL